MKHFFSVIIVSGNSLAIVTAVTDKIKMQNIFDDYTKNDLFSFRSFMPTDTNENSDASTSMTTIMDNNNNTESSSTTDHIQSPPLSSSPSTTTTTTTTNRSNSPIQTLSKQLDKLQRFLSTLYYFGLDISNDIGERVRALILALVVSTSFFF